MKEFISRQRRQTVLVFMGLAIIIAGCGGVGTGGTGGFTASISGKVADGYLVNATVFMDKNGNYQWDTGEPLATTDANGGYKLDVTSADIGNYPIVALAIKGVTIDKDTNQAVPNSYLLSMPKESVTGTAVNNFISPLSSQLREIMETGKYSNILQAKEALRTQMGLPAGTDVTADYIDPVTSNTALHAAAQNMATLMGNQMDQVFGTGGSVSTVDVNRYRGMMGTIFTNMPSIMGSGAQAGMTGLNSMISTTLPNVPRMTIGYPFQNMSSAFRGMIGGINTQMGWMR